MVFVLVMYLQKFPFSSLILLGDFHNGLDDLVNYLASFPPKPFYYSIYANLSFMVLLLIWNCSYL